MTESRTGRKPAGNDQGNSDYTARKIHVLKGLDAVRKRPGMYIGSTSGRGLHHLVYEVVDNSIDEAMAGYCSRIDVRIGEDQSIRVADDGRGIPVDLHPTEKVPGVELALTTLHAGGKFDKSSYKVSGGLHGVGVSVVNALSEWLEVEVRRDGHVWSQRYERGVSQGKLGKGRKTKETGTTVTFRPDPDVFTGLGENLEYSFDTLANRLRELAYLNRGVRITLVDERREGLRRDFHFEGGIAQFVKYLLGNRQALHSDVISSWPATRTTRKSNSPCSTRTPTARTRSPSSTTSAHTRAEPISRGSRAPSPARSTATRSGNNILKKADPALSGGRTCARGSWPSSRSRSWSRSSRGRPRRSWGTAKCAGSSRAS